MNGEQPTHKPGQRFAIPRRQALEHRQDVGFEESRGLSHERPAVVGKADQHNPPVRDRRNAHDQVAPLSAIDQARNAGLVESQDPRQFVHGRLTVPQHPEQARLRSANLRLQGSGQGAVGPADYLAEMPSLIDAISNGAIAVRANTMPLADVEEAWTREEAPGERTVLVP
jgi:hypothetical protein